MNSKRYAIPVLSTAAALLAVGAQAAAATRAGLSPLDKTFLKQTAQSNIGEIDYKPMVDKMTRQPQYLAFAERMVQDHTKAELKLEELAVKVHFQLPAKTDPTEMELKRRLSREPRSRFDPAYKHEMIRDHTGDIGKTRREISLGRNPEVRAYAEWILPVLKTHLALAKALPAGSATGRMGKTGNAAAASGTSNAQKSGGNTQKSGGNTQ